MDAGAAAVEMFRNGQLPDTGAPPIVLPSGSNAPEANGAAEIADAEKDEKDTSETGQQPGLTNPRAAATPPLKPAPSKEAAEAAAGNSALYPDAYDWISV